VQRARLLLHACHTRPAHTPASPRIPPTHRVSRVLGAHRGRHALAREGLRRGEEHVHERAREDDASAECLAQRDGKGGQLQRLPPLARENHADAECGHDEHDEDRTHVEGQVVGHGVSDARVGH
jgi:hypothetical protein